MEKKENRGKGGRIIYSSCGPENRILLSVYLGGFLWLPEQGNINFGRATRKTEIFFLALRKAISPNFCLFVRSVSLREPQENSDCSSGSDGMRTTAKEFGFLAGVFWASH
jgi:hypothetical protein